MGYGHDTNLVPGSMEHRRALEKMRSKLVTAKRTPNPNRPVPVQPSAVSPEARAGLGKAAIAAVLLVVVSVNVYSYLERDDLVALAGPSVPAGAEPDPRWDADDMARFYAYAAYSPARLEARFGIPGDRRVNREQAAERLAAHLANDKVSPMIVEEVQALKAAHAATHKMEGPL